MKTQNRHKRLKLAKSWVKTYPGNNLVKGYSKQYGIDKLCAIKELRLLGIEISEEYENQLIQSFATQQKQKQLQKDIKKQKLESLTEFDSDENFAFIAGYTSGGFPYGITHEEMEEINKKELE